MRTITIVLSWLIWLCCTYIAVMGVMGGSAAVENPEFKKAFSQQSAFQAFLFLFFSVAVGTLAFWFRRRIYFQQRRAHLDDVGGVFFWLCLSAFGCSFATAAGFSGPMLAVIQGQSWWLWVCGGLALVILVLGLPLAPKQNPASLLLTTDS